MPVFVLFFVNLQQLTFTLRCSSSCFGNEMEGVNKWSCVNLLRDLACLLCLRGYSFSLCAFIILFFFYLRDRQQRSQPIWMWESDSFVWLQSNHYLSSTRQARLYYREDSVKAEKEEMAIFRESRNVFKCKFSSSAVLTSFLTQ